MEGIRSTEVAGKRGQEEGTGTSDVSVAPFRFIITKQVERDLVCTKMGKACASE